MSEGPEIGPEIGPDIGIVGGGAWGTALAMVARRAGARVVLWAREPEVVAAINAQHVNVRSPRPDNPIKLSTRPRLATPKRIISARPRVISAARALSPRPRPSAMPQAIASTFLTAPPISTPIGSGDR